MKAIVLLSGGADSMLQYLLALKEYDEVVPVFIAHEDRAEFDLAAATTAASDLTHTLVVSYPIPVGENSFIPFRNYRMVFDALTAVPDADVVLVAGIEDDRVGDKTPEAFAALTTLLNTSGLPKPVVVKSDLFEHTKGLVYKSLLQYSEESNLKLAPLSCYSQEEKRCGKCKACVRTAIGIVNGVDLYWKDIVVPEHRVKLVLRELRMTQPFGLTLELLKAALDSPIIAEYQADDAYGTNRRKELDRFIYLGHSLYL